MWISLSKVSALNDVVLNMYGIFLGQSNGDLDFLCNIFGYSNFSQTESHVCRLSEKWFNFRCQQYQYKGTVQMATDIMDVFCYG